MHLTEKQKEHIRCEMVAALRSVELEISQTNANLELLQQIWIYQMEVAEQIDEHLGRPNFTLYD